MEEVLRRSVEWEKEPRICGPKEPCPTVEEVERSIEELKPGKAVAPDDIPAELLKLGGETMVKAMHRLIQIVWETIGLSQPSYLCLRKVTLLCAQTTGRYL
jgi:hypothetical protein